jgi:zinc transport system substrate-binding protein
MHGTARGAARALLAAALLAGLASAAAAETKVVVTIKPLHALVAQVMGDTGSAPELLVQGAASAHTYALKPSDAAKLHQADLFFRMSDSMEPFTAKLAQTLPKRVQVVTLQDTRALKLLRRRTGATFEDAHDHDDDDDDHGQGHGHTHGAVDGHAWLDPANAKLMAQRIAQALSARDPAKAAAYRANADALAAKLDALDAELKGDLARVAGKPFVVFHDALQYFERRYRLKAVGSIAISPEMPPGAKRLSTLRKRVSSLGAVCVFAEPQFDTRLADNVVEGTKARIGRIDPEGSRIEAGPDLYFTLLRNLAKDLRACLG